MSRSVDSDDPDWQLDAACRGQDPAIFYPPPFFERKELRRAREAVAKSICAQCPVSHACLQQALRTEEPHGVWGGLNEFERRERISRSA
ncbi:MAG TPA: WhiB family transcriptional regulator [Ilumatobacteraceae bacterium]|nr:WhiB family transcriptional regulator [Ilumatobacteraceae bacterium]